MKNRIQNVAASNIILSFSNEDNFLACRPYPVDFSYHNKYNIRQRSQNQKKQALVDIIKHEVRNLNFLSSCSFSMLT
jgi:hypothetical protein